jgi:hypothetical protein
MPYFFMPCGRAILETTLRPFQGWPAGRAACLFRHPMPYAYAGFCQFNNKKPAYPVRSRTKLKIIVKEKIGQVCHLGTHKLTKKDTQRPASWQDVWPNA